ncbi:CHAT domain-containing protein [Microcoleus sp. FACHB-1515]|nr:CHAT domain-containing protein [Microcoleus sp. FACHB-1515]
MRWIVLFWLTIALCFVPSFVAPGAATEPPILERPTLEQQSRSHYEAGQYPAAIDLLEQAIQQYQSQGDWLRQAIALGNLALVYRQTGNWTEANAAIDRSLDLLQPESPALALAQILDIQAQLQLAQGQAQQALGTWERAARLYEQGGDRSGRIRTQINQAQALQELGLIRRSIALLTDLRQTLPPDSQWLASVQHRLGDALIVTGNLQQARMNLEPLGDATTDLQLSLGNLIRAEAIAHLGFRNLLPSEAVALLAQSDPSANRRQAEAAQQFMQETQTAIDRYQQAARSTNLPEIRFQAQLNGLSLLIETERRSTAETLAAELVAQVEQLPIGHDSLFDRIGLAQNLIKLNHSSTQIAQLLQTAQQQAIQLQDRRAQSFALGTLGELYEPQQPAEARSLTQQALILAQSENAADIAYRWQWQIGRLLKAQGDRSGAIAAYTEAVNSLQILRQDLVAMNRDVQFSFREGVEPVYRQLVDLLLQPGSDATELQQARSVIEGLQIAELDNFFREACLDTAFQLDRVVDQADRPSAIFYTIGLGDRLEVILKLPQQNLIHYTAEVSQIELEAAADALLAELKRPFAARPAQDLAQQLYRWLIAPAESALAQASIETLVFVLDGTLRNLPMAALYDGQHYLIERYSIALAPGLQLLDPRPLNAQQLRALVAGLSEARENFPPLSFVQTEVDRIQADVSSSVLFNESFTKANLRDRLRRDPVAIVHIATHGQFSSNAEETFILAWDSPIRVNELSQILETRSLDRDPIELLVLSACRTAVGDRRAALGLAGVAVRAGARSTIASLWSLDDDSGAVLMSEFYKELAQNPASKAEALRRAQQTLIANPRYAAPRFWAPYVLLGNWL